LTGVAELSDAVTGCFAFFFGAAVFDFFTTLGARLFTTFFETAFFVASFFVLIFDGLFSGEEALEEEAAGSLSAFFFSLFKICFISFNSAVLISFDALFMDF
jgi:hypothetical protein